MTEGAWSFEESTLSPFFFCSHFDEKTILQDLLYWCNVPDNKNEHSIFQILQYHAIDLDRAHTFKK